MADMKKVGAIVFPRKGENLRKFARGDMYNIYSIYPFFSCGCIPEVFEGTHFYFLHAPAPALAGGTRVPAAPRHLEPR